MAVFFSSPSGSAMRKWMNIGRLNPLLWRSGPRASANFSDQRALEKMNNASIKPLENFVNRNPRNLERLCYSQKDFGWGMEWSGYAKQRSSNLPRKDHYHRLVLRNTSYHTYAEVEHYSGKIVVSASTLEWCIRRCLYKNTDVSAAANLGRIIASRCLRAGISCLSFRHPKGVGEHSERIQYFQNAAIEGGLVLEEPSHRKLGHVKPHEKPTGPRPPDLE